MLRHSRECGFGPAESRNATGLPEEQGAEGECFLPEDILGAGPFPLPALSGRAGLSSEQGSDFQRPLGAAIRGFHGIPGRNGTRGCSPASQARPRLCAGLREQLFVPSDSSSLFGAAEYSRVLFPPG